MGKRWEGGGIKEKEEGGIKEKEEADKHGFRRGEEWI